MTYWWCGPGLLPLTVIRMAISVMHHHHRHHRHSHSPWAWGVRVGSLKLALGRAHAARCAASGEQAPASTCSLGARGFGGCPRASSLQSQSRGTYRRFPSGSADRPQTGAVSEAVPSTVFHQRLDPADNCSVLYPVGDNQERTNFTQVPAPAEIHTHTTYQAIWCIQ